MQMWYPHQSSLVRFLIIKYSLVQCMFVQLDNLDTLVMPHGMLGIKRKPPTLICTWWRQGSTKGAGTLWGQWFVPPFSSHMMISMELIPKGNATTSSFFHAKLWNPSFHSIVIAHRLMHTIGGGGGSWCSSSPSWWQWWHGHLSSLEYFVFPSTPLYDKTFFVSSKMQTWWQCSYKPSNYYRVLYASSLVSW